MQIWVLISVCIVCLKRGKKWRVTEENYCHWQLLSAPNWFSFQLNIALCWFQANLLVWRFMMFQELQLHWLWPLLFYYFHPWPVFPHVRKMVASTPNITLFLSHLGERRGRLFHQSPWKSPCDLTNLSSCQGWDHINEFRPHKGSRNCSLPSGIAKQFRILVGKSSRGINAGRQPEIIILWSIILYHSRIWTILFRKWDPFQGPKQGSCLTLGNELSKETYVLTKQEILLGKGTLGEQ